MFLFSGCNLPAIPDNGYRNVSQDGSIVSYSCETGYTINGPIEQVCLSDGSGWDAQVPDCCKLSSTLLIPSCSETQTIKYNMK